MKRRIITTVLAILMVAATISTTASGGPGYIPVEDIVGVQTVISPGVGVRLEGMVLPANATNRNITWSVTDPGTAGAYIADGNLLNASSEGLAVVTATIADGAMYPKVKSIAIGFNFSAVVLNDGSIWTWGSNQHSQLGDGTTTFRSLPDMVGADNDWEKVFAGLCSAFAIKKDGSLWAWGYNRQGALGDGTTINRYTPVRIGTDCDWATVSSNDGLTMAIKNDGSLWAWGYCHYGVFGNDAHFSYSPVRIGTDTWMDVSVATFTDYFAFDTGHYYAGHTLAIRTDGSLWAWGINNYGQLGDGTTMDSSAFVRVGGDNDWVTVSAGYTSSLAVKHDGSLWAWGNNSRGQLGDGTGTNRSAPVRVGTDNNWISAKTNSFQYPTSYGIKNDGSLWTWGLGSFSGSASTAIHYSPVIVGSADDHWLDVSPAGSGFYTIAVKNDGSLWGWGDNYDGVIGDGTQTTRQTPSRIGADKNWGENGTGAFKRDFTIRAQKTAIHKVSFYGWNNEIFDAQWVFKGETVPPPYREPAHYGQEFIGWYLNRNDEEPYDFSKPVTKDFSLYAKWEPVVVPPREHKVTFILDEQTVVEEKRAVKPKDPTKDGFTFRGWYIGSTQFDFNTPIMNNITLRAGWKEGVPPTVKISGEVTSNRTDSATVIVLLQEIGRQPGVIDTIVLMPVTGAGTVTQGFSFAGVAPGDYSILITKGGHPSHTINVTVGASNITLDTITLLPGDINDDGDINVLDLSILLANFGRRP